MSEVKRIFKMIKISYEKKNDVLSMPLNEKNASNVFPRNLFIIKNKDNITKF